MTTLDTRIGLIGPAEGDLTLLRKAAELMLERLNVDQTIYLGIDEGMDRVVDGWRSELMQGDPGESTFVERAIRLTKAGQPAEIEALLAADEALARFATLRSVCRPPKRAVELLDDRIVMVVFDKAVLTEDDIANSHIVVFGRGKELLLKQFGPRAFFSPGPLQAGKVGVLGVDTDGLVSVEVCDLDGRRLERHELKTRAGSKMTVSQ